MSKRRILLVEPYYGGSHKHFLDGIRAAISADFVLLHLPARKWKMRMQLAAPWSVEQIRAMPPAERAFDVVLLSSFIDAAVFRALVGRLAGWNPRCRLLIYFHENQFVYPGVLDQRASHQFTAINFTSALAADGIAFNSEFNRTTFFTASRAYLNKAADMDLTGLIDSLEEKSVVLYPGIDFSDIDAVDRETSSARAPVIVWNHRWEHDKNPEECFAALHRLSDESADFRLVVLGQSFRSRPRCFAEARHRLAGHIDHFGFASDRERYIGLLKRADIVVSTAHHEFFGIAVMEAVRCGCRPVLPRRLVYPELFEDRFLYGDGGLYSALKASLRDGCGLAVSTSRRLTDPYSWAGLRPLYEAWLGIGA